MPLNAAFVVGLLVVAAFVVAIGIVPALAVTRRWDHALPLSGAITGLVCTAAGMASLVSRTALLPWVVAGTVSAGAAGAWWLGSNRGEESDGEPGSPLCLALVSAPGLTALAGLRAAPVAWDPRSIWFFHGLWFQQGGEQAAAAMANNAFAFTFPDYPPLAPTTIGALWTVFRGGDRWVALTLNVMLSLSAAILVGMLVIKVARPGAQPFCAAVGGLLALALFGTSNSTGMIGLVDLLWAAWMVAAALTLLVLPWDRTNQAIGTICLAAAGSTKAEGTAMALVVLMAVVLRHRRALRRTRIPALALVPIIAWTGLARSVGAEGTGAISGAGLRGLLSGEVAQWDRVGPTLAGLGRQTIPIGLVGLLVVMVAGVGYRDLRGRYNLASSAWLLGLCAPALSILGLVYVTGIYPLDWWLRTSADRTTVSVRALVLTEVALCLVLIIDQRMGGKRPIQFVAEPTPGASLTPA